MTRPRPRSCIEYSWSACGRAGAYPQLTARGRASYAMKPSIDIRIAEQNTMTDCSTDCVPPDHLAGRGCAAPMPFVRGCARCKGTRTTTQIPEPFQRVCARCKGTRTTNGFNACTNNFKSIYLRPTGVGKSPWLATRIVAIWILEMAISQLQLKEIPM